MRQVHDLLTARRPLAYTTTLKLLQIMMKNGLVGRSARGGDERRHVYEARLRQEDAQRLLLGELLDRAFGGSAVRLVTQALATGRATAEDLDAIRRLLDEPGSPSKRAARAEDDADV